MKKKSFFNLTATIILFLLSNMFVKSQTYDYTSRGKNASSDFIKNVGQWNKEILYLSSTPIGIVRFLNDGLSFCSTVTTEESDIRTRNYQPQKSTMNAFIWNTRFENVEKDHIVYSDEEKSSVFSFLYGSDAKNQFSNVPQVNKIFHKNIYNKIDVCYYQIHNNLKYDIILHPGSRITDISIKYEGIEGLKINENGELEVTNKGGNYIEQSPYSYQLIEGEEIKVNVKYVLLDNKTLGFTIDGNYDHSREIIIDPIIRMWSTYMRSTATSTESFVEDLEFDKYGNEYITGRANKTYTNSITPGSFQTTVAGDFDVFVSKMKADGNTLLYSTFIGGSEFEKGFDIELNKQMEAFVSGYTTSENFPRNYGGYAGGWDGFVLRLNAAGNSLIYSRVLGGSDNDNVIGIAIDEDDNLYATGAAGIGFPTTVGAYDQTFNGGTVPFPSAPKLDAFVFKLKPTGSGFIYSTYWGQSGNEYGNDIEVASGEAIIVGQTNGTGIPLVLPIQSIPGSSGPLTLDCFIARFNSSGSSLLFSTWLGGNSIDDALALSISNEGKNIYLAGLTYSTNYPTTSGVIQGSLAGFGDGFVTKISKNLGSSGYSIQYSTYLGGAGDDEIMDIELNENGEIYTYGRTSSSNYPVLFPYQSTYAGNYDYVFSHLDKNATSFSCGGSTYLGGNSAEHSLTSGFDFIDVPLSPNDILGFTGNFVSSGLGTVGTYQPTKINTGSQIMIHKFEIKCDTIPSDTIVIDTIPNRFIVTQNLSQQTDNEVSVYPNPHKESFILVFTATEADIYQLVITNSLGKQMNVINLGYIDAGEKLSYNVIDSTYPDGIYFTSVRSQKKNNTIKIIKRD